MFAAQSGISRKKGSKPMTRAKFRLNSYTTELHNSGHYEDGKYVSDPPKEKRTLNFTPVMSDDKNPENRAFWEASPSGSIQLGIVNQAAWTNFEIGKEYYVDFTPAN